MTPQYALHGGVEEHAFMTPQYALRVSGALLEALRTKDGNGDGFVLPSGERLRTFATRLVCALHVLTITPLTNANLECLCFGESYTRPRPDFDGRDVVDDDYDDSDDDDGLHFSYDVAAASTSFALKVNVTKDGTVTARRPSNALPIKMDKKKRVPIDDARRLVVLVQRAGVEQRDVDGFDDDLHEMLELALVIASESEHGCLLNCPEPCNNHLRRDFANIDAACKGGDARWSRAARLLHGAATAATFTKEPEPRPAPITVARAVVEHMIKEHNVLSRDLPNVRMARMLRVDP